MVPEPHESTLRNQPNSSSHVGSTRARLKSVTGTEVLVTCKPVSEPRNYSNSSSLVGSTTAVGSVTGTEVTVTRKRGKQCWRTHGAVLTHARAQSFGANETIGRRTDGFRTRSMRVCLYVAVHPSLSGLGATVTGCLTRLKGGFLTWE